MISVENNIRRQVYIQLKRKRETKPIEDIILIKDNRNNNNDLPSIDSLASTLENLSSSLPLDKFVFTRVDSFEACEWMEKPEKKKKISHDNNYMIENPNKIYQMIEKAKKKRNEELMNMKNDIKNKKLSKRINKKKIYSEYLNIKKVQNQTINTKKNKYHMVEIVLESNKKIKKVKAKGKEKKDVEKNIKKDKPFPVLTPFERALDEGIWYAFQENDFNNFILNMKYMLENEKNNKESKSIYFFINFQRPVDGTTILMAAANYNRIDIVDLFFQYNNDNTTTATNNSDMIDFNLKDHNGLTAIDFAIKNNNILLANALESCKKYQEEKNHVYDIYCMNLKKNLHEDLDTNDYQMIPKVKVDKNITEWITEEMKKYSSNNKDKDTDLIFDYDNESCLMPEEEEDISADEHDSEDSNDERYMYNDYPEEEEDEEDDEERLNDP